MDDYLTKPLRAAELWEAIGRVMADQHASDLLPSHLLSPSVLLAACGADAQMLKKMCRSFTTRAPEYLSLVDGALRDRDASTLRELAHKFNGLVSAFSTPAGDLAASLEDVASIARFDEARALFDKLRTIVPELIRKTDGLTLELLRREEQAASDPESVPRAH
jgi:two-component system sensor histidine kinase/response regulator